VNLLKQKKRLKEGVNSKRLKSGCNEGYLLRNLKGHDMLVLRKRKMEVDRRE